MGGVVVLTRQVDTSDEAYELAVSFKQEMQKELLKQNRFVDDLDAFKVWITKWIAILKDSGFHNIKASHIG